MVLNSEELTVQGSLYYVQNNHFYRILSIVWAAWNEWEQCSIRYKGFPSGGKYPEGLKVGIQLFCVIFDEILGPENPKSDLFRWKSCFT